MGEEVYRAQQQDDCGRTYKVRQHVHMLVRHTLLPRAVLLRRCLALLLLGHER
jgi:hypothetical protein